MCFLDRRQFFQKLIYVNLHKNLDFWPSRLAGNLATLNLPSCIASVVGKKIAAASLDQACAVQLATELTRSTSLMVQA